MLSAGNGHGITQSIRISGRRLQAKDSLRPDPSQLIPLGNRRGADRGRGYSQTAPDIVDGPIPGIFG